MKKAIRLTNPDHDVGGLVLLRSAFLAAHIPLFLYPFLHTVSKTRPFEYLRLTSLGVIGKKSLFHW